MGNVSEEPSRKPKKSETQSSQWIEVNVDYTDGEFEEEIAIPVTNTVEVTPLDKTGEYEGKEYPMIELTGFGQGYCTCTGYLDEEGGHIYIPRQVAYEYKDYGEMYIEAAVINAAGKLAWDGQDVILTKNEATGGYIVWDGTEEPGSRVGWIITMTGEYDGSIWTYGVKSELLIPNGEESGSYNWGSGYGQESHPIYAYRNGNDITIYNFLGQASLSMFIEDGEVYIPTGQPIAAMLASAGYPTDTYGEYFRTYHYDVAEDNMLSRNEDADYTMATYKDNKIDIGVDGYIGVWSKFDEESRGYRLGIFGSLNWTFYNEVIIDNIVYKVDFSLHTAKVVGLVTKTMTNIIIPSSITYNGVEYVVNKIEESAFQNCSDLTSVTIPTSVTSIGNSAFQRCSALTSLTVGSSVRIIGGSAFANCSKLKEIYSLNTVPPAASANTFENVNALHAKVFVPEGSGDDYKYAVGWMNFLNIYETTYSPVLPAADPITISDAAPAVTAGYYTENTVKYVREGGAIREDNYASFCLPFAVDPNDAQFKAVYVPVGVALHNTEENTLRIGFYQPNEILTAGTPFLAKLAVDDRIEVSNALPVNYDPSTPVVKSMVVRTYDFSEVSGIMSENEDYSISFSGTYTQISPANANTFNTNGSVGPSASVVPFRAYVALDKNNSGARLVTSFDDDMDVTGIEAIGSEGVQSGVAYNLAGQRVAPDTKGIMIINGKKIVK